MGPNTTTYVLPSESFPTEIRATCHGMLREERREAKTITKKKKQEVYTNSLLLFYLGISAACGKLGAVVGSAMMQPLLDNHGLATVLVVCAVVAFTGAVFTFLFTVETLGKSLEQINTTNKTVVAPNM